MGTFVRVRFADGKRKDEDFLVERCIDLESAEPMTLNCGKKLNPGQKGPLIVGYRSPMFKTKVACRVVALKRICSASFILSMPRQPANEQEPASSMASHFASLGVL